MRKRLRNHSQLSPEMKRIIDNTMKRGEGFHTMAHKLEGSEAKQAVKMSQDEIRKLRTRIKLRLNKTN